MAIADIEAALSVLSRAIANPAVGAGPEQSRHRLSGPHEGRRRRQSGEGHRVSAALSPCSRPLRRRSYGHRLSTTWEVYADRVRGERASNRQQAVAQLQAGTDVFTRDAAPLDHSRTSRLLGRVPMESGDGRSLHPFTRARAKRFFCCSTRGFRKSRRGPSLPTPGRYLPSSPSPLCSGPRRKRRSSSPTKVTRGCWPSRLAAGDRSSHRSTPPARRSARGDTFQPSGGGCGARNRTRGGHR